MGWQLERLKSLKLRLAEQAVEPVAQAGRSISPAGVLAVDDEAAVLRLLEAGLQREGFRVWLASHGHQAVNLYQRHREEIAVVLLDVVMPGLDGPHTLAAIRKLSANVRCCFMTGNPSPYTEESLLEIGAVRVFRKPFAFTEVIDTLNQLARQSPRCRQE